MRQEFKQRMREAASFTQVEEEEEAPESEDTEVQNDSPPGLSKYIGNT